MKTGWHRGSSPGGVKPARESLATRFARQRLLLPTLLLLGLVGWAFGGALANEFINYDDPLYVTENADVKAGLTLHGIFAAFTQLTGRTGTYWHPLTWLSHMLDCQLFGLRAGAHHGVSVVLHAANVVLLFGLLKRMTGATWRSAAVAALFAVHPLQVDSVAWVAERKNVLSTLFWLLSLGAYARWVEEVGRSNQCSVISAQYSVFSVQWSKAVVWYGVALGLFACGLMSKPMLVTMPFVLLLLDYWPLRRFPSRKSGLKPLISLLLEKVPFLVLSSASSLITIAGHHRLKLVASGTELGLWQRLANALVSYVRYLGKVVWPSHLAVYYPYPGAWPWWDVAGAAALLLAISGVCLWQWRRSPFLLMGWLWFLGTLVPAIGLVQVSDQALADRFAYVPVIGLLVMAVWGGSALGALASRRRVVGVEDFAGGTPALPGQLVGAALATAAVLLCAAVTRQQAKYWKNTRTLFEHALAVTGINYLAHAQLGAVLVAEGRPVEAIGQYEEALRENPASAEAHNNLGLLFIGQGRLDEARKELLEALKWRPNYAAAHNNLGELAAQQGRPEEALHEFDAALQITPDFGEAHGNRAIALARQGRQDEASAEFQAALRLQPNSADAHNNLGVMLEHRGQSQAAIPYFQAAIKLQPGFAQAHFNLGVALANQGSLPAALEEFQTALQLKPDYVEARKNLESVRAAAASGDPKESRTPK